MKVCKEATLNFEGCFSHHAKTGDIKLKIERKLGHPSFGMPQPLKTLRFKQLNDYHKAIAPITIAPNEQIRTHRLSA